MCNIPFLRARLYGNIFVCQYYLLQNEKFGIFSLVFTLGLPVSKQVKRRKVKYVPERTITGNDLQCGRQDGSKFAWYHFCFSVFDKMNFDFYLLISLWLILLLQV